MAGNRLCPACKGTGVHPQLKKDVLQVSVPGVDPEVVKYTCPYCGYAEGVIDTRGATITEVEEATLKSMLGMVAKIDVGRKNTSPEQNIPQPTD